MRSKLIQRLTENVKESIEQHGMFENVSRAIIAFSAGPDSVCLLDVLHSLYKDPPEFELVYVNHGLRSKRACAHEEKLTQSYAVRYGLCCKILRIHIRKTKIGIEAAARNARSRALLAYMDESGAQRIVLGHNLDDFAETFLLNIIRGSGMRGLRSIPAARLPFVRPLLNVQKRDILEYLRVRKLPYAIDKTNVSTAFRRNLLRLRVLPVLERINPQIHETLKREVEILKQDDEYIWQQAEKAYRRVVAEEKDGVLLDLGRIVRYNLPVINRIVMKAIMCTAGSLDGFESKHYRAITSLTTKESGRIIVLPKGLYAQREFGKIVIGYRRAQAGFKLPSRIGQGTYVIGNYRLNLRIVDVWNFDESKKNREVFDLNVLSLPLYVRHRRDGDFIRTKIGRKKVKKIFGESRIGIRNRDKVILLCDQEGILWMLGITRAYRGFVNKDTKRFLVVDIEPID